MIRSLSIAVFLSIALVACQKPFDVAFPYDGDKFLMYAELDSDQAVRVRIDRTYPPTGAVRFDDSFLNQTVVTLYEDGELIDTLQREGKADFVSSKNSPKLTVGKFYSVRATAPNFSEAISINELMLPKPNISEISVLKDEVPSLLNPQIPAKVLIIKLNNVPQKSAYIRFEITGNYNDIRTSASVSSPLFSVDIDNPCITQGGRRDYLFKTDCIRKNEEIRFFVTKVGTLQTQSQFPDPDQTQFPINGQPQPPGPPPFQDGNREINNIDVKISAVNAIYHDFHVNFSQESGIFAVLEGIGLTVTNVKNGYGAILCNNAVERNIKLED